MESTRTTSEQYDRGALDAFDTMVECAGINPEPRMMLAYLAGVNHAGDTNMATYRRTGDEWFHERARGNEHGVIMYLKYQRRMRELLYQLRADAAVNAVKTRNL